VEGFGEWDHGIRAQRSGLVDARQRGLEERNSGQRVGNRVNTSSSFIRRPQNACSQDYEAVIPVKIAVNRSAR
jgi:hypothetical protein